MPQLWRYWAHINKLSFGGEFLIPRTKTFVKMTQVGAGYSLDLPMALVCYPAVVGCDYFLEVSQLSIKHDMRTEVFYFPAVSVFVAVAAAVDDEESVEVNNVLSLKGDIGIAEYGSGAAFQDSWHDLLHFPRYGKMPLSAVIAAAAADNDAY